MVCAGPKNYAYKTHNSATGESKTVCKVRGITLNYNASQLVNFAKMKDVILITQNFFHQAPHCRDISLNAKYLVALKNVRDRTQFSYLARQVLPEASASLCAAYKEATRNAYGYLILDFAQDTDDRLRYRTNVFPSEYSPVMYALLNDEADKIEFSPSTSTQDGKTSIAKRQLKTDSELVKAISECVLNVLQDNLKITPCPKKLKKFKGQLRVIANRRVSLSAMKGLINQQGGFLVSLLSAILPTLASLIFRPRSDGA